MKRTSLFKRLLALVFAVAVVYTVSVKEVHYLFSQHQVHEHCENHLHSDEHQEDCSVCKFDIAAFTDQLYTYHHTVQISDKAETVSLYLSPFTVSCFSSVTLRGPPARV